MSRGPNVIERLRELQKRDGWLTDKGLAELSRSSNTPVHELFGVASFYPEFHLSEPPRVRVQVCTALPCQMRGSEGLVRVAEKMAANHPDVQVRRAPCLGACERAPVAIVDGHIQTCGHERTAKDIVATIDAAIAGTGKAQSWFPHGIKGPFKTDPYSGPSEHFGTLKNLLQTDGFGRVIEEIKNANLRGMGGAGKPAERKWAQVAEQHSDEKFVVANADESEPGTLKDREILRNLPHLVVEGMIIAGLTVGAKQGYIYLRHEYEEQHEALEHALAHAKEIGLMGDNIGGTGKSFDLRVFVSPGGYVLGEASALLEALEGKRGQPRNQITDLGIKSGVPSYNGLWGKPTVVNNVETYLYVPIIMAKGAQWYNEQGINGSTGIKFASVCGDVNKPGVFEIPMGLTFAEIIEKAGGPKGGWENFKAFAPSGPTYGFRPLTDIDTKMDFPDVNKPPQCAVGSGAIIVLDKSRCMIDAAINFTRFFRNESCGKCVPCRVGSKQLVHLIRTVRGFEDQTATDTANGREALETIDRLNDLLFKGSICGLGQVVPAPLVSVRKYWAEDVESHLKTGRCQSSLCPVVKRSTP
jgi:NADH:ubiquinone oxidoreductase subunit F (NADH-binding)/NADH:ubiquinone oxidoreductase subunit E